MLERLWTSILELMAQVVTPDWGVLVSLIPVGILILVIVILLRLFLMLAKAPPARRGKGPVRRKTPAGIHMPGPSFAPIFAGVGLFLVMLGLVFGGLTLVLGIIALVLTLLYWLAEGLRLYDRDIGPTAPELPAEIHEGPPPGVHMPGPSWRPFFGAFGVFALFLGPGVRWLAAGGRGHRPDHDADRLADRRRPRLPTSRRGGDDRPHRQRPTPGDAAADVHGPGRPDRRRGRPAVGAVHDRIRRPVPAGRPRRARRVRRLRLRVRQPPVLPRPGLPRPASQEAP